MGREVEKGEGSYWIFVQAHPRILSYTTDRATTVCLYPQLGGGDNYFISTALTGRVCVRQMATGEQFSEPLVTTTYDVYRRPLIESDDNVIK